MEERDVSEEELTKTSATKTNDDPKRKRPLSVCSKVILVFSATLIFAGFVWLQSSWENSKRKTMVTLLNPGEMIILYLDDQRTENILLELSTYGGGALYRQSLNRQLFFYRLDEKNIPINVDYYLLLKSQERILLDDVFRDIMDKENIIWDKIQRFD